MRPGVRAGASPRPALSPGRPPTRPPVRGAENPRFGGCHLFSVLNFTPATAGTVFLFGGDAVYDPASGTYFHGDGVRQTLGFLFIERDFGGNNSNNQDPLTLHTYLYADATPILGADPSGHYFAYADLLASIYVGAGIETGNAIATLEEGEFERRWARSETDAYEAELEAAEDLNYSEGPGQWTEENEAGWSQSASNYDAQIGGHGQARAYEVNGVKFDGYGGNELLEAKGAGYAKFVKNGRFRPWFKGAKSLVAQAQRQVIAARGTPIVWHFAEQAAANATSALFAQYGITGIQIVFTAAL